MNNIQKYNPQIHRRRSVRLKDYDYSQNGAYFITICTQNRKHIFGQITKDDLLCSQIVLNVCGKVAEKYWLEIPEHFPNALIDKYVIMPNHIHGIIIINDGKTSTIAESSRRGTACRAPTGTNERFGKPQIGSMPTIIRSYKSAVSKRINEILHTPGQSFWQRNYFEHIIRNDNDFYEIRKYINDNPRKWEDDKYNPAYQHR